MFVHSSILLSETATLDFKVLTSASSGSNLVSSIRFGALFLGASEYGGLKACPGIPPEGAPNFGNPAKTPRSGTSLFDAPCGCLWLVFLKHIVPLKQIEYRVYGDLITIYPKPYSIYLSGVPHFSFRSPKKGIRIRMM